MILSISHTDLDGIGCQAVILETFSLSEVHLINISYNDLYAQIDALKNNAWRYETVFITDLMIKDIELFNILTKIAEDNESTRFIYIDHHSYDVDLGLFRRTNLNIHHTKEYSASMITLGICKKKFGFEPSKELVNFIKCVNAFDIFDREDEHYPAGFRLFKLSTHKKYKYKIDVLLQDIKNDSYNILTAAQNKLIDEKIADDALTLESYEKAGAIFFCKDFVLGYSTKEYIIDLLREKYEKSHNVFINFTLFGAGSVRINDDFDLEKINVKQLVDIICRQTKSFKSLGGHDRAFGISFDKNTESYKNDVMFIGQEIFKTIQGL